MGVVIKRDNGERIRNLAYKHGIPINTVETIVKGFLADLIESAERNERIVLDNLTSITVVKDLETGEYFTRGRVSPALQSRLKRADEKRKQEQLLAES